jgi:hypothetical protein
MSDCSIYYIVGLYFIAESHQTLTPSSYSNQLNSQGSIPAEIGELSNLWYLRLSYNAFTGTTPKELGELKKLQLLQLQSNKITEIPNIPRLNDNIYGRSTFVADCGVPSAFDEPLRCQNCTMCCKCHSTVAHLDRFAPQHLSPTLIGNTIGNANDDCYPQEKTQVAKWGLNYGTFAAICFACFIALCCMVAIFLYLFSKRMNLRNPLSPRMEAWQEDIALTKICSDSVYSYFVSHNNCGRLIAFVTLGIQFGVLFFFTMASDANLQEVLYTWNCPRDNIWCNNTAEEVTVFGWVVFAGLMTAFLAKDFISGCKLIYHSA